MGKDWLFAHTKQFQPQTADCLLNGGKLFACGDMPGQIPLMSFYVEANGVLVVAGTHTRGTSPEDLAFNIKFDNRFSSLPEPIITVSTT